ncbi:BsuPI-related putative proteinase inhibitor [Halothermothrix orenii]|uniref:Uncharacterized protein n=1 Tax=Halothermothrix orenii (strain H 168 / OCM 544 / DSM 9562) TaxID=373903 RepID=B8CYV3_HALOH|nr:BsuPI-related putative proteinase inhibitor [Halothermothrix orenii]ACL70472.1 hypothetical protein Hore_17230 [Halothermothrix orenii H 168]
MRQSGLIILIVVISLSVVINPVIAGNVAQKLTEPPLKTLDLNTYENKAPGVKLIKLRELGRYYGWVIGYIPSRKTVTIMANGKRLYIDIREGELNDVKLDNPPVIEEGRTYFNLKLTTKILNHIYGERPRLMAKLDLEKKEYHTGEMLKAKLVILNLSVRPLNLTFNSGKKYDLVLYKAGKEVKRWSRGKFFTMALEKISLKPGENKVYRIEMLLDDIEPGNYYVNAELATNPVTGFNGVEIKIE